MLLILCFSNDNSLTNMAYLENSNGVRMRQTLHQNSAAASGEVRSFNAISVRLRPVQPRVICGDAVGPANSLRHDAGDVRSVHPAAVDARRVIAPVSPKHQAERDSIHSLEDLRSN